MRCSHCRIESHDLRAYARLTEGARALDADETVHLCPACRVLNALHPRYVSIDHAGDALVAGTGMLARRLHRPRAGKVADIGPPPG